MKMAVILGIVFVVFVTIVGEHVRWTRVIGHTIADQHPFMEIEEVEFLPPDVKVGWTEHARTIVTKEGRFVVVCNNDMAWIKCDKIRPK